MAPGRLMLYFFSFKCTSGQLNSKDFRRVMTRATQKEQATFKLPQLCKTKLLKIFRTFYQRNLRLSFLDWEPKCGNNIHLGSPYSSFKCNWIGVAEISSFRQSIFFGFVFFNRPSGFHLFCVLVYDLRSAALQY